MDNSIVKNCKNCGPLLKEQVRFRKTRKEITCKLCDSKNQKKRRLQNPEKFKAHGNRYRYLKRDLTENSLLKCSKCKLEKGLSEYNTYMLNIRYPYCRSCRLSTTKQHHDKEENKKKHKQWYNSKYEPIAENARLIKYYGISLSKYNKMLKEQNFCCGICKRHNDTYLLKNGKLKKFSVDHNHLTGTIRGLLCHPCNMAIGSFKEDINNLKQAMIYLQLHA